MRLIDFKNYIIDFMKSAYPICGGTTVAQLIAMASVLFISRIYNPDQFGTFTMIITLAGFLGSVACFSFENAFLIDKDNNVINTLALCITICTLFSALIWFTIYLISLSKYANSELIKTYINNKGFIAIYIFATGLYTTMMSINFRLLKYNIIGYAKVVEPIIHHFLMILFGLLNYSINGMLYASLTGLIMGIIILITSTFIALKNHKSVSLNLKSIKNVALKFLHLPKYYFFTNILVNFNFSILIIAFGFIYDNWELGLLAFALRILRTPYFVTKPLSSLFINKISAIEDGSNNIIQLYTSILIKLMAIAICSIILLNFVPDSFIAIIFGNNWTLINQFMKICVVFTSFEMVQNVILGIYLKIKWQKLQLVLCFIHSLLLVMTFVFIISYGVQNKYQALSIITFINSLMIGIQLILPLFYKGKLIKNNTNYSHN